MLVSPIACISVEICIRREALGLLVTYQTFMPAILLVFFPLLLMIHTRAAWLALAAAIVLLCNDRLGPSSSRYRRQTDSDTSI
jgi:hypothetical protein